MKWICSVDSLQPHGSHAILQAKTLDWVAFPFSKDFPNPGIEPRCPSLQVDSLPAGPQGKPKNIYRIHPKKLLQLSNKAKTKTDFFKCFFPSFFIYLFFIMFLNFILFLNFTILY